MKRKQSKKWFVKLRGSYLPNSWQGWLTYIPYIAYLGLSYTTVVHDNHNGVLSKVLAVGVYWVVGAGVMNWIASKKS